MPTIQAKTRDLAALLGGSLSADRLDELLPLVKGEIKDWNETAGEIKLELNDTNRPDLWCVEGIARQIRTHLGKKPTAYPFFGGGKKTTAVVKVAPEIRAIRPYIGACIARGLSIDEETLVQLIQTQEKLADGFGRKRRLVSIGLYRLSQIAFPVSYKTVRPDEIRFIPLGWDVPMTPAEILDRHPKGKAYAEILSNSDRVPLLVDREERILSLPPIINSREVGEVKAGDRDLFVEVTGTDLRMVGLAVNILAANLADRGAAIQAVEIHYPYSTEFGKKVVLPGVLADPMEVTVEQFTSALGESLGASEIASVLKRYGYRVRARGKRLSVSVPPYRDDLLHSMDVVEDFAISRGYGSFKPRMPSEFTVGGLSKAERKSDWARDMMVGLGFQEVVSNILSNREELLDRMNRSDSELEGKVVSVKNVMSQTYSTLRNAILPSLLRVEAASSKSFYPHRLFEAGETALVEPAHPEGTQTVMSLGALVSHSTANFSELHSDLEVLMYYWGLDYRLVPARHPSFLEGRAGTILVDGHELGVIGELHPEVLEKWQIGMPCAGFELRLDRFL